MANYTKMDQNLSLYEDKLLFYLVCSDESELTSHMQFAREVCFSFVGVVFVVDISIGNFGCEYTFPTC